MIQSLGRRCHAAPPPRRAAFIRGSSSRHSRCGLRYKRATGTFAHAAVSPPCPLSSPMRLPYALLCHAARPPRRATARPSAKNTLRLRRNCFFACGSRCFPAPGRSALLCRGGPCGRPRAGVGTRPYKPVFSPFPYSHPPGWPRLPLQGNLSSVRIGPLGGDKPRPYAAAAGRARAKGHAAGYACGVSSSSSVFFVRLR